MSNQPGTPEGLNSEPKPTTPKTPDVPKPVDPESSQIAKEINADLGQPNVDPDKALEGFAKSESPLSQMDEARRVAVQALGEPDPAYDIPANAFLKGKWLDELRQNVEHPVQDPTQDGTSSTMRVWANSDASLANPSSDKFVSAYLHHLGTDLKVDHLRDIASGAVKVPRIKEGEIETPRESGIVIVEDENGQTKYVATKTKMDGVQLVFDGSAITKPTSADRTVRPMVSITTK